MKETVKNEYEEYEGYVVSEYQETAHVSSCTIKELGERLEEITGDEMRYDEWLEVNTIVKELEKHARIICNRFHSWCAKGH